MKKTSLPINGKKITMSNDKLLVPDGFGKADEILSKNYNIIKIKVDEISKLDAGLSCMSLRW